MPTDPSTVPVRAILHCPRCHRRHVDRDQWATKPHATHRCEYCLAEWDQTSPICVGVDEDQRHEQRVAELLTSNSDLVMANRKLRQQMAADRERNDKYHLGEMEQTRRSAANNQRSYSRAVDCMILVSELLVLVKTPEAVSVGDKLLLLDRAEEMMTQGRAMGVVD